MGITNRYPDDLIVWASSRLGAAPITLARDGLWHGHEWEFGVPEGFRRGPEQFVKVAASGASGTDPFDNFPIRPLR